MPPLVRLACVKDTGESMPTWYTVEGLHVSLHLLEGEGFDGFTVQHAYVSTIIRQHGIAC